VNAHAFVSRLAFSFLFFPKPVEIQQRSLRQRMMFYGNFRAKTMDRLAV